MAHIGHNVLIALTRYMDDGKLSLRQRDWIRDFSQTKIVVSASINKIKNLICQADDLGIPHGMVDDVNYGYPICAAIGPVRDKEACLLGLLDLPLFKLRLVY